MSRDSSGLPDRRTALDFELHTARSAPAGSKATLEQIERRYGFVPNLFGLLAASPAALEAYTGLSRSFDQSDLNAAERQVVVLAASFENGCEYCMAVHSMTALRIGLPESEVERLRTGEPLVDSRLEALRSLTRSIVVGRGRISEDELQKFRREGFEERHLLEVAVGVALKTLSNYANHMLETPLDHVFQDYAWPAASGAATPRGCCAA